MTREQLGKIMAIAPPARLDLFYPYLIATMERHQITSPAREAAFLAQVAVESGECRYVLEIASGDAYEGRHDLGNTQQGDGRRFKGRGLIQVTGRANYTRCGQALGLDLLTHPELLEQPEHAVESAGWFWSLRKLNDLADRGEFDLITRKVNGGTNGAALRRQYYFRALKVLGG